MRILLSAFACLPDYGSESGIGWCWATSLAAAGHTVHVLTRRTNQARIEAHLASEECRSQQGAERDTFSRVHFIYVDVPYSRLVPPTTGGRFYLAWQVAAWRSARLLVREHDFDLAQHVSYGAIQVPSLLALLRIPLVFGPCGGGQTMPASLVPLMGSKARAERLRSALIGLLVWSPLHRMLLRRTALLLATNRETMRLARRAGCPRVEFMLDTGLPDVFYAGQGKPVQTMSSQGSTEPVQFLWVGSDRPRKGLLLALEAMEKAKRHVRLTIISGDGFERLSALIQKRGLGERVHLQGRVEWTEMGRFYRQADCLLFTSIRDSFGSQLLEAAAQALPILCLDQHGAGEFVTDAMGYRVKPSTPEATAVGLAGAIDRFAALPLEERAAMSLASLERHGL